MFQCYYWNFPEIEPCRGTWFPAGYRLYITQWASGRAFRINYRLDILADWLPLEEKRRLQRQARAAHLTGYPTRRGFPLAQSDP